VTDPNAPLSENQGPGPEAGSERCCSVCDVKLSLYNPGPNCWQHTLGWPWRGPTAKPKF